MGGSPRCCRRAVPISRSTPTPIVTAPRCRCPHSTNSTTQVRPDFTTRATSSFTTCRAPTMRRDLTVVAALTAVTIACALASAPTVVTAVLGIPVLLLAPGYVWLAALLPAPGPSFERSVLTVGLSLIVLVLGGLALQVTNLPLDRTGWSLCLAVVITVGTAVAWRRPSMVSMPRLRLRPSRSGVLLTLAGLVLAGAVTTAVVGARTAPQTHFTSLGLTAISADSAVLQLHNAEGS